MPRNRVQGQEIGYKVKLMLIQDGPLAHDPKVLEELVLAESPYLEQMREEYDTVEGVLRER